jgi:hypothetical protein
MFVPTGNGNGGLLLCRWEARLDCLEAVAHFLHQVFEAVEALRYRALVVSNCRGSGVRNFVLA